MTWTDVSNIASISTLILFGIYFVGRIWYVKQLKNEVDEFFDREYSDSFKIIDEFDVGENTCEEIYLTAKNTLLNVCVYECVFDAETGSVKKGKRICACGQLRNGFTFKFNTYLVEGIPMYMLEYTSNDYTKGQLFFQENGKNGVVDTVVYRTHTCKSVLYYLFK